MEKEKEEYFLKFTVYVPVLAEDRDHAMEIGKALTKKFESEIDRHLHAEVCFESDEVNRA